MPRPTKLAKLAIEALEDLKGVDIKTIEVQKLTTITDTMIVCTGTSNRHVKSLANSVIVKAKEAGFQPAGVEGMEMGEWVLVNLGGVIVHIMQLQARAFYQLEKLWDLPPPVEADEASARPRRSKPKAAKSAKAAKPSKGKVKPKSSPARGGGKAKKPPAKARKPRGR